MDNELDLNLDELDKIEANADNKLQVKNRFQQLSEKVKLTAQEREEALTKAKVSEEARLSAEKERDFFKNFSQVSSKHPEASAYQEQILERVNKGMDTEEATIAVLYKEGKLNTAPQVHIENVAGGSAPNTPGLEKNFGEMNLDEKRDVLLGLEKTGELDALLRR